MKANAKILISIIHEPPRCDDNFERLKYFFRDFDIYIPKGGFYGDRWKSTKNFISSNNYDSVFLICSDVSIVCGDVIEKIKEYANNVHVGAYGFGTINNCTFNWQRYNNIERIKSVPFIEGFCFGANKSLLNHLELDNVYGYGVDVEIGYKSHLNGLHCILDNEVCISHQHGKNYDNNEATKEYSNYLLKNSNVLKFLNNLNIPHPLLK